MSDLRSHTETASWRDYISQSALKCGVPPYMIDGLTGYFVDRIPPGSFLQAVLENDLMRALGRADSTNIRCLEAYGRFLYNHAPAGSYGSHEKVNAWLEHHVSDEHDLRSGK